MREPRREKITKSIVDRHRTSAIRADLPDADAAQLRWRDVNVLDHLTHGRDSVHLSH